MARTPGPWVANHYLDTDEIGVISHTNRIVVGVSSRLTEDDAHLIAAAPELLGALKGLAADVEKIARDSFSTVGGDFEFDYRYEDPVGYAVWSAAREAIAKAEGRA